MIISPAVRSSPENPQARLSLPINQRRFLYKSPIVAQPLRASHNAGSREWGPVQSFFERDILQIHTVGKGGRLQVCFFVMKHRS
jgi:hypothetical protein